MKLYFRILFRKWGHGDTLALYLPPTFEIGGSNPYVENLAVAYRWLASYSTEPEPTVCTGFLCPRKLTQLNHRPHIYESDKTYHWPQICIMLTNYLIIKV